MDNLIESQVIDAVGNLVVSGIKSIARHNKTGAALLNKVVDFDKRIKEHREFLNSLMAVLGPAMHLAHQIISKFLPGYIHIVDMVTELCKDVYSGVVSA